MKFRGIKQLEEEALKDISFDLVICASGFEKRATHVVKKYKLKAENKFCFSFKAKENILHRLDNDRFYRTNNFRIFIQEGGEHNIIIDQLKSFLAKTTNYQLNILIDYSCMTRTWYAAMLAFFRYVEAEKEINLFFSYSVATFSSVPHDKSRNLYVGPMSGFHGLTIPNLPTAVIIGLGYIEQRALGLTDYLDAVPYIFYTDSSGNNEYSTEVEKNNHELLAKTPNENIYLYPLADLEYTYQLLVDLCRAIKAEYRIVLAPCGPKTFTLLSLLTSIALDDVDVWRISAGDYENPSDKIPDGRVLLLKASFE
jgi:hypothetical protein